MNLSTYEWIFIKISLLVQNIFARWKTFQSYRKMPGQAKVKL